MHALGIAAASSGLASCVVVGRPLASAAFFAAGLGLVLAGAFLLDS